MNLTPHGTYADHENPSRVPHAVSLDFLRPADLQHVEVSSRKIVSPPCEVNEAPHPWRGALD